MTPLRLDPGSYLGRERERRKLGSVTVTRTVYAGDVRLPRHAHANPYFCLVWAGSFVETSAAGRERCPTSALVFHAADEAHSDRFGSVGGVCVNLELRPEWMERALPPASRDAVPARRVLGGSGWLRRLLEPLLEPDVGDDAEVEVVAGVAAVLLHEVTRPPLRRPRPAPAWLAGVRATLHRDYARSLGLGDLARAAGVHPVHLSRSFRACYGWTVGDYLRFLRLDRARREIERRADLADAARIAGFHDQSHLTRWFVRRHGTSPGVWRDALPPADEVGG